MSTASAALSTDWQATLHGIASALRRSRSNEVCTQAGFSYIRDGTDHTLVSAARLAWRELQHAGGAPAKRFADEAAFVALVLAALGVDEYGLIAFIEGSK